MNPHTKEQTLYQYDLASMLQTNTKTTFTRAIRRSPPPPSPTWQFEEYGNWHAFDDAAAAAAEAALQVSQ